MKTVDLDYSGQGANRSLQEALALWGPYKVEAAPNAYSFERLNSMQIDWESILKEIGITARPVIGLLFKQYIERAWGIETNTPSNVEIDTKIHDLTADWPAYIHNPAEVWNTEKYSNNALALYKLRLKDFRKVPYSESEITISEGCVIELPTRSGTRWYQPVIHDSSAFFPRNA